MCILFSFITYRGKPYYFGVEDRLRDLSREEGNSDSHTAIAEAKLLIPTPDDRVNKYEFANGRFSVDQINDEYDDTEEARTWVEKFSTTEEFDAILHVSPRAYAQWKRDVTEDVQLAAVKQSSAALSVITKPSRKVKQTAVAHHGEAIQYINNPPESLKMLAVRQNGCALYFIKKASLKVQMAAIRKNPSAIRFIKRPSAKMQMMVVRQSGDDLGFIRSPSSRVMLAAIRQNPYAIRHVPDPSEALQLEAVKIGGWAVSGIRNPSEKVQLAAVRQNPRAICYICNPSQAVLACSRAVTHDQPPVATVHPLTNSKE